MRVMLDTNVLISIIVLRSQNLTDMMTLVLTEHRLVLSSYVIEELKQVVARKFEGKSAVLEVFLQALPYENDQLKRLQLREANKPDYAFGLLDTYVISDHMADVLTNLVFEQLQYERQADQKGLLARIYDNRIVQLPLTRRRVHMGRQAMATESFLFFQKGTVPASRLLLKRFFVEFIQFYSNCRVEFSKRKELLISQSGDNPSGDDSYGAFSIRLVPGLFTRAGITAVP